MEKKFEMNYDSDNRQYVKTETQTVVSDDGTKQTITSSVPLDEELNKKIKSLADLAEKGEVYTLEQLKFLLAHKDQEAVAPELSRFSSEYLKNLRQEIAENRTRQLEICREVTNRWADLKKESMDPLSAFLFSFMTAYSHAKEVKVRDAMAKDINPLKYKATSKENAIAKMFNAMSYNEGDVKIFHMEKDGKQDIRVIRNKEEWEGLAKDEEFKKSISDAMTQTSLYSTTKEKYAFFESYLTSSEDKKSVLKDNLGDPAAQKTFGDTTLDQTLNQEQKQTESKEKQEQEKVEQEKTKQEESLKEEAQKKEEKQETPEEKKAREEDEAKMQEMVKWGNTVVLTGLTYEAIAKELPNIDKELKEIFGQDIDKIKQDGRYEKLLNGEKVTLTSMDGNIDIDVILNRSNKDNLNLVTGNINIKEWDKLSDEMKQLAKEAQGNHLLSYMDEKERMRWQLVRAENIPDNIKGHSVTFEEKQELLKGKSITLTDCTEGTKKPYTVEVHANLHKTPDGIKPVLSIEPKAFTKQNQEQAQKQQQKQGIKPKL